MVLWAVIRRICVYLYLINVLGTSSDNLAYVHFTNSWAVHIPQVDEETVKEIARRHGMINLGQVGSLEGFYHFKHRAYPRRMKRETIAPTFKLSREFKVKWVEQQVVKKRVKRDISYPDPLWPQQWYLHNRENLNYDHNVLSVWKKLNIIGRGVSVSILDDGIDLDHPDLKANYDPDASYDYNSHDSDPSPRATYNNENRHGTRCAGEVAAVADNNICGIGVAYGAKVGGIRMLDGEVTDVVEANSLSYKPTHIDVYSSSWGPDDDGKTVDGPGPLAKAAFSNGIDKGRGGLGNIFVWASGNGGREQDNCNCDGYTNSIYTLSISSATERGTSPWYSEYCASTLASTFSSGGWNMRKIVTTDLHHQCTTQHTGTSASAPLASGILALALEANPKLTWRDMQHIVVRTSKPDKLKSNDWVTNGVGRRISHRFGYGLLDARALVDLAIIWPTAPEKHKCEEAKDMKPRPIPHSGSLLIEKDVVGCQGSKNSIQYLEHVEVVISLSFTRRGDLTIAIISPQGTKSTLLGKRFMDYSTDGFNDWAFMSTHSWGENPRGTWRLELKNVGDVKNTGTLTSWQLRFHGTQDSPDIKYKSCSGECKNGCNGPSARDCVECANFKSNGVCVSRCEEHEYSDNVTKECRPCSNPCEKCQGPGTNDCIMCTSSLYLKDGSCVVNCPDGWFISDNHTCERCDSNCLTCSKKAVLCSSCKKYQKLEMNRCVMNCKKNEFVSMERCWPCHPSCLSCNNDTAWSCTKCDFTLATRESVKQDLYLHRGMCVVQCPTGFYGESHQCLQCHSSCKYCRGPLKTDCTTCKDGLVRADNGTGLCLDYCPSGSSHRISEDTCVQCGLNCSACDPDNPSQCTACPQGKFLWRGACLPAESCPRSTYPELNTSRCQFCHPSCGRCSDLPTICTACFGYSYLHNNKCNLVCPNGTFGMNNTCQFCKPECLTCFGANQNQCLTCINGFKFFNNTCVKQCPRGMFVDHNGRCQRCSLTCKECIGEKTNCTSCVDGFIKVNGTCKSLCDDGTFYNVTLAGPTSRNKKTDRCSRCHVSCLTCTGPMKYDCLRCKGVKFRNPETALCSLNCPKKGFYEGLSSSLCEDCPSECESCINPLQCSKCIYGLFLHNGRCVSRCPEGFYADNRTTAGVCLPCNRKCESCAGTATSCTQCSSSLILYNQQCLLHCPSGMFFSNDFKSCLPCHNSCLTCVGVSSSRCTLCKSGLVFFRGQCRSHCPIRYYHNNASHSCEPCGNYCHRCSKGSDPSTCEECISPFVLQHNTCVRTCSAGYVLDYRQGICVRCHATCATCMGPTENECVTCKNDQWSLEGSLCKKSCGKGWYKDPLTSLCESCHPLCKTCSGPGEAACTSCVAKLSLLKGRCVSSCKEDQYRGKNGKCYMCSSSCKSCKDANINDCLSCNDGEKLYNYTCVKTCPYGSYEKKSNDILECSKCHPSCVTCVGAGPNTCTSCRADLYLEGTKCVKQCSMFHMIEEDTRKCKLCTNDCPVDMNITDSRWLLGRSNDNRIAHIVYTNHEKRFIMISFATCGTFLVLFALFGLFKSRSRRGYTVVENTSASNSESQQQTLNNNVPCVYIRDEQSQREREAMLDDNDT